MAQGDKDAVTMRFRTQAEFWQFLEHAARTMLGEQGNRWVNPTGLKIEVDPTATGGLAFSEEPPDDPFNPGGDGSAGGGGDGQDGDQLGPAVDTDPASRDRMRSSAAEAREELARQQAQEKAQEPAQADAAAPAPKARGRPRKPAKPSAEAAAPATTTTTKITTEDQGGDSEMGDRKADEAALSEPTDYAAAKINGAADPARAAHTPAETRAALIAVLREVHRINRSDVEAICTRLEVTKLSQVPDDQVSELWNDTEALCAKYGLGFPPSEEQYGNG